jgi:hypothetical protein
MKTRQFYLFILLLTAICSFGCSSSTEKVPTGQESVKEEYQCPMKCTDEIFTEPGKCPVCKMDLEQISSS